MTRLHSPPGSRTTRLCLTENTMTDNNDKHVNAIHMKGNDNAKKDEADKATALVQMRMTPEKKSRYVREAKRNGLTISAWIQRHMDQVCDESDVNYLKKKAGEQ